MTQKLRLSALLQKNKISEEMVIKENLRYTESHEWVKIEGDIAYIGITDFAQHELGDIVFIELPEIGDEISKDESFGTIEAVKSVEDIMSPLSGEVLEVNEILEDAPETINKSAFEDGWLIKIKIQDTAELDNLLSAQEYKELIDE